jgi:putative hemolysin
MWVEITLVVVLILLNAALAGSEMAFVSLRESQANRLAEESGDRGQILARLVQDPNRFLSTIQVGITLAGFLASATAAVTLAEPLVEPFGFLERFAEPAAVFTVTVTLSYLTLVLGELVPKRIAMQQSQGWALRAAGPITIFSRLVHPVVWLLARSTELVVKVMGFDPHAGREEVTEEEIKDILASHESMPEAQRSIIAGALELDERRLWQVLVPRSEVVFLRADLDVAEGRRRLIEAGLSRAPVTGASEDDVVGVVHIRALVDAQGLVGRYVRDALVLPDSVGVLQALSRMQRERAQLALVVDEFGSVAGIVTLEDLLEEIVGEIYDEYDRDTEAVVRNDDGSMDLPGSFPAHDLPDLGVDVDAGRHATIAGVVLEALGEIPEVGQTVQLPGWRATVLEVTDRAILRVRLEPLPEEPEGERADETDTGEPGAEQPGTDGQAPPGPGRQPDDEAETLVVVDPTVGDRVAQAGAVPPIPIDRPRRRGPSDGRGSAAR